MPNLKEVRNRIVSVNSTMQITSAMKMVSASKLRKAQDAVIQLRPYANKLSEIMGNVSSSLESGEGVYSSERELNSVLIVAVSSNRGLCGAFNSNIIKGVKNLIETEFKGVRDITVLPIGKKVEEFVKKTEYGIRGTTLPAHAGQIFDGLNFEAASEISQKIMDAYAHKQFDRVVLVYNQFKNAAVQVVVTEQMLPLKPAEVESGEANKNLDYIFEPEKARIVEELIPKSIKVQFYKALLDSHAAEHGARMTSMHKATDNANSLIGELKLSYNKARQAAITSEILEIVAGAEALN